MRFPAEINCCHVSQYLLCTKQNLRLDDKLIFNNVFCDREFVLHDFYDSKISDFYIYQQYDPFNLDDKSSSESKAEFRVETKVAFLWVDPDQ